MTVFFAYFKFSSFSIATSYDVLSLPPFFLFLFSQLSSLRRRFCKVERAADTAFYGPRHRTPNRSNGLTGYAIDKLNCMKNLRMNHCSSSCIDDRELIRLVNSSASEVYLPVI